MELLGLKTPKSDLERLSELRIHSKGCLCGHCVSDPKQLLSVVRRLALELLNERANKN